MSKQTRYATSREEDLGCRANSHKEPVVKADGSALTPRELSDPWSCMQSDRVRPQCKGIASSCYCNVCEDAQQLVYIRQDMGGCKEQQIKRIHWEFKEHPLRAAFWIYPRQRHTIRSPMFQHLTDACLERNNWQNSLMYINRAVCEGHLYNNTTRNMLRLHDCWCKYTSGFL